VLLMPWNCGGLRWLCVCYGGCELVTEKKRSCDEWRVWRVSESLSSDFEKRVYAMIGSVHDCDVADIYRW
jgi:hypothetical protein